MPTEREGVEMCLVGMKCSVCMKSMVMYPEGGTKTYLRLRYNAPRQSGVAGGVAWEYHKAGEGWTAFGARDTGALEEEYWRHATSEKKRVDVSPAEGAWMGCAAREEAGE
eukprot:Hpha_TRINITY_DN16837_c2_g6::TRINITY_DN16837_c2_g6_i1::g.150250::m.150250